VLLVIAAAVQVSGAESFRAWAERQTMTLKPSQSICETLPVKPVNVRYTSNSKIQGMCSNSAAGSGGSVSHQQCAKLLVVGRAATDEDQIKPVNAWYTFYFNIKVVCSNSAGQTEGSGSRQWCAEHLGLGPAAIDED
jgi:hypothetical protein